MTIRFNKRKNFILYLSVNSAQSGESAIATEDEAHVAMVSVLRLRYAPLRTEVYTGQSYSNNF